MTRCSGIDIRNPLSAVERTSSVAGPAGGTSCLEKPKCRHRLLQLLVRLGYLPYPLFAFTDSRVTKARSEAGSRLPRYSGGEGSGVRGRSTASHAENTRFLEGHCPPSPQPSPPEYLGRGGASVARVFLS